MGYFITFMAGMGFAALVDFTIQAVKRFRSRVTLDLQNEVLAINPTTTQIGDRQMAALRNKMGI